LRTPPKLPGERNVFHLNTESMVDAFVFVDAAVALVFVESVVVVV